ncbi:hypothetical protein D3C81_2321380 [compost metagenome]
MLMYPTMKIMNGIISCRTDAIFAKLSAGLTAYEYRSKIGNIKIIVMIKGFLLIFIS